MKTLKAVAVLALGAIAMTAVVGQAQAHHKPGYHDGLPKVPLTLQAPRLPKPRSK